MPDPVLVKRVDAGGDNERVRTELRDWRRPVVFQEAGSPAYARFSDAWSPDRFRELVGDHMGHARYYPEGDRGPASDARAMKLRDIFDEVSKESGAGNYSTRLAIHDPDHQTFAKPLFDDIQGLCDELASLSWGGYSFDTVWFGGPGTITPLHYDPVSRLHGVLRGKKLFTLYPADRHHLRCLEVCPARSSLRNYSRIGLGPLDAEQFPSLTEASPVEALLEPADVLYIPPCWWHHVTIAEPFTVTASVAYFPKELYRLWAFWRLRIGSLLG